MQLSKRTQYGIRALVCLAEAYDRGFLQAGELARREKLPAKFLEAILNALARSNFLISKIGAAGGYRLARAPKDIMLGEVVARLEGRRLMQSQPAAPSTERPGEAAIRLVQTYLTDAVRKVLDTTSLADLVEQVAAQGRAGHMYFI
jgi:Rrf2 family transcriptional regulator, cysteine metabolism repressor